MFSRPLFAGWGDMDFNSHMRNTAFLDKAADVRMMFFAENGFAMEEFTRRGFGPVIMKDEIEYLREVRLLEKIEVGLAVLSRQEVVFREGRPPVIALYACGREGARLDLPALIVRDRQGRRTEAYRAVRREMLIEE